MDYLFFLCLSGACLSTIAMNFYQKLKQREDQAEPIRIGVCWCDMDIDENSISVHACRAAEEMWV